MRGLRHFVFVATVLLGASLADDTGTEAQGLKMRQDHPSPEHKKSAKAGTQPAPALAPLAQAAKDGDLDKARALIESGDSGSSSPPLDQTDRQGWTPLMWAAYNGHSDVVELLVQRGARADVRDKHGWGALLWATRNSHAQAAQTLLSSNASIINQTNEHGGTPLMWATSNDDKDVVEVTR
jgi:ankyrin repeat protein